MEERLRIDDGEWNAFVAKAAAPSFMQTSMWAGTKRDNGWTSSRVIAGTAGGPIGAEVLIRRAPLIPFAFGYAPRGPLGTRPLDDESVRAFTEAVRVAAGPLRLAHVRIDPGQEDPAGELRRSLLRAGWIPAPEVQPPATRIVDLDRTEEAIWEAVHPKWRKAVRRSERDGLTVASAGGERIADFHRIHGVSMDRVGLHARTEASFRELCDAFEPTHNVRLLFAETPDGAAVATLMLVGWGPQVVTLYSGMTDEGRRLRGNYLLRWHALKLSHEDGYRSLDLWGLPTERIDHWKSGWGGRRVEFVGAWDLVLNPAARLLIETGLSVRARLAAIRARRSDHGPADTG